MITKKKNIYSEWTKKDLQDVVSFINGKAHENIITKNGKYIVINSKFISSNGSVAKTANDQLSPLFRGDVAIVMSDVPNGKAIAKCYLVKEDNKFTLNQRIGVFRTKEIDSVFLYYLLNRNKYFLLFDDGVNQTNLRKDELLKCPIVYPSLAEQNRIVKVLDTWDKVIEKMSEKIKIKKKIKLSLMQKLLTGAVRLPGFTGEWRVVKLDDIGNTYPGITGKDISDFGKGKPFISYMNVYSNSKIDTHINSFVDIKDNEQQNKVKFGDLFFTTSSETPNEVGISSVLLDKNVEDVYLNSFCFGFRLNDFKTITPIFAQYYFRGQGFRKQMTRIAQGASRYNLSKKYFLDTKISIPKDAGEQVAIANILMAADNEIDALKKELTLLKEQKKYLLNNLITGKIRTPENLSIKNKYYGKL